MRGVRGLPVRAVRAAATVAPALGVRLVPVQRRGVRRLRILHVLREGALLPLRERRGGGGRAVRARAAVSVRGCAVGAAAVSVAVLAAARVRGGGRSAVRARAPLRMPLPGASDSAAPPQYYLVPRRLRLRARLRSTAAAPRTPCTNIYWVAERLGERARGGGLSATVPARVM